MSRRSFLKMMGIGAAATGAGVVSSTTLEAIGGSRPALAQGPSDTGFWRQVKNSFMLDRSELYMNIGGTGSMPRHVVQAFDRNNRLVAANPSVGFDMSEMRQQIAEGYGCGWDEIVMSSNTTDGMSLTLHGLDFEPGDEIITTNHEHPGGDGPMTAQATRHGAVIRRVQLPVGADQSVEEYVDLFRNEITDRTKVICFSHITYLTGTLLPAKEICELAIERGITTVIDGAHATGMMNLDFHDMGVDFYAGSGHKWQCGPGGTGLWYIRNAPNATNPNELPMVWGVRASNVAGNFETSRYDSSGAVRNIGSFMMGHGRPNHPERRALADSCNYWQEIGRGRIEAYVTGLSAYLKQRVADLWGREALMAPDNPALLCGLTTFNPFADKGPSSAARISELVSRLRDDYGIRVVARNFPAPGVSGNRQSVRVSTHLFHDRRDVDKLVDAVVELVNDIGT